MTHRSAGLHCKVLQVLSDGLLPSPLAATLSGRGERDLAGESHNSPNVEASD